MCVLYVSFGSKVRPRTFGCVAMHSAVLFITSCSSSPLNIGMTLATFSLSDTIPREMNKFIKCVNG